MFGCGHGFIPVRDRRLLPVVRRVGLYPEHHAAVPVGESLLLCVFIALPVVRGGLVERETGSRKGLVSSHACGLSVFLDDDGHELRLDVPDGVFPGIGSVYRGGVSIRLNREAVLARGIAGIRRGVVRPAGLDEEQVYLVFVDGVQVFVGLRIVYVAFFLPSHIGLAFTILLYSIVIQLVHPDGLGYAAASFIERFLFASARIHARGELGKVGVVDRHFVAISIGEPQLERGVGKWLPPS